MVWEHSRVVGNWLSRLAGTSKQAGMELNLPPLSHLCQVSSRAFVDGDRVVSYLERDPNLPEIKRTDLLEEENAQFQPKGQVVCRWVHLYKQRAPGENRDRALKLTAENLFLTLADPTTEPTPENNRLLLFLGLMMERKRLIKLRGRSADGLRQRYEHVRTKQIIELPVEELTPEFFLQVHEQLSILVGSPKLEVPPPPLIPSTAEAPAASDDGAETAGKAVGTAQVEERSETTPNSEPL